VSSTSQTLTELPTSSNDGTTASAAIPSTTQPTSIEIVTTKISNSVPNVVTTEVLTTLPPSAPSPPPPSTPTDVATSLDSSSSTLPAGTDDSQQSSGSGGGLQGTEKVVVAVVVPIVAVALIAAGVLLYWRKRQQKASQMKRKSEVEDYSFNPNAAEGSAMGAIGARSSDGHDEMLESSGGYRGWGSTNGGMKMSNMGSSVGSGQPLSPTAMGFSEAGAFPAPSTDGNVSNAPLVRDRSDTTESNGIGAMAGEGVHRGDSNASSNYSAMTRSDNSDNAHAAQFERRFYGPDGVYDEAYNYSNQPYTASPPIIQDVQARRNTRIETPTSAHYPQQGNSGIAQNF
jgi:hypothetical protein